MSMKELMAAGNSLSLGDTPEGVSFDGSNDYLSRTSDLSGNSDSKTFTFSAWVYVAYDGSSKWPYVINFGSNGDFYISNTESNQSLSLVANNSGGTRILQIASGVGSWAINTLNHALISVDLANSSNRHVYINDALVSATWNYYTNDSINFTNSLINIGANKNSIAPMYGRLAHVFLDYTYRDLSIESNRRLFIDSDGKPATGQSSVDKYLDDTFNAYPSAFASSGGAMNTITFNGDGSKVYYGSSDYDALYQYSLSTSYDITTSSYDNKSINLIQTNSNDNPVGASFNSNGSKLFVSYSGLQKVSEYALSTNYDVSTASLTTSFSVSSQLSSPRCVAFNSTGTTMYLVGSGDSSIYTYTLSTGFDISTASYTSAVSTSISGIFSINFDSTGYSLYLNGAANGILQYSLSTPYTVSTLTLVGTKYVGVTIYGQVYIKSDSLFFGSDSSVYHHNLVGGDITTASYGLPEDTPQTPILYLPMKDAATAGSNSGTGGDFTVNGVLDTAQRGPNQFNCSASEFDSANDYLSKSSITGLSNGTVFTTSFTYRRIQTVSQNEMLISFGEAASFKWQIYTNNTSLVLRARDSSDTYLLSTDILQAVIGVNYHITLQWNVTTNANTLFINGVEKSLSHIATAGTIDFTGPSTYYVAGSSTGGERFGGAIGEFYFDTTYTDLSTENVFWDADANRPKPVRQVISETGTTPLIALPMRGDDAGNNLGSGGDFTVNSGPYTGARGGSEFWARSAETTGTNGNYLSRSTIAGGVDSANITLVFAAYFDTLSVQKNWFNIVDNNILGYNESSGGGIIGSGFGDAGWNYPSGTFATGGWYIVHMSMISNGSSSQRHAWVNGVNKTSTGTWSQTRTAFALSESNTSGILSQNGGTQVMDGKLGFFYIDQSYTDFSQESNRNLFVDQLGYPKDLGSDGSNPTGSSPLIYMKFDDISDLGKNSGTGGDFTVNGTVTAGADVDPNA